MAECRCKLEDKDTGEEIDMNAHRLEIVRCPTHAEAFNMVAALEGLLAVQPCAVKIPGTNMGLTVSYTEGDLLKMETAKNVLAAARGGVS
jgi:hypothetical protein